MSGCTNEGPFEGGVYRDSTVVDPEVIGGKWTNAAFSGSITLDEVTAISLVSDICPEIKECVICDTIAEPPSVSEGTELPTTLVGGRELLLGKPLVFIRIGDYLVPAYDAGV